MFFASVSIVFCARSLPDVQEKKTMTNKWQSFHAKPVVVHNFGCDESRLYMYYARKCLRVKKYLGYFVGSARDIRHFTLILLALYIWSGMFGIASDEGFYSVDHIKRIFSNKKFI